MKRLLLLPVFLLLILSTAIAGDDINITSVVVYDWNSSACMGTYPCYFNDTIDFNIHVQTDANAVDANLNIYLDKNDSAAKYETVVTDLNVMSSTNCPMIKTYGTAHANLYCIYTYNTTGAPDGNYFVDVNFEVYESAAQAGGTADINEFSYINNGNDQNRYIDNTHPSSIVGFGINRDGSVDGQFLAYWDAVASNAPVDFNSLSLFYSTSEITSCSGTRYATISTYTTREQTVTGLSKNTAYYFCLQAEDAAGNTTDSSIQGNTWSDDSMPSPGIGEETTTTTIGGTTGETVTGEDTVTIGTLTLPTSVALLIAAFFVLVFLKKRKPGRPKKY